MRLSWLLAVLLVPLGTGAVGTAAAQIDTLPRPADADTSTFGVSVAMDDSIAVVGASGEQSCGPDAGAVYVYERGEGITRWRNTARLTPRDCREKMFFGSVVAVSGSRILVGASNEAFPTELANAAYVFERREEGWVQTARLTGSRERSEGLFAAGLDLEGNRAVVSTSGDAGGTHGGAVYVFEYRSEAGAWRRTARLTADSERVGIGHTVALDGNHIAVAASAASNEEPGSVYLFHYDAGPGSWHTVAQLRAIEAFFIDLDLYGDRLVVGQDRAGSDASGEVSVYERRGHGDWRHATTLRPSVPYESGAFGTTVSTYGDAILAAGYNEQLGREYNIDRVVYAFRKEGDEWRERRIFDIGEVDFGAAMAQGEGLALISSVPEGRAGTVYVVGLP